MPEDVGLLRAVILGQIHVEIGGSLGLIRIEAQRPRSPCRGRVRKNLLCRVVDRMTSDKGSSLRPARSVVGIGIDLLRRLLDCPTHEIDVGDGMSKLDSDELRWIRTNTSQHVFDEPAGAAVPARSDTDRPEPESGALEVEIWRAYGPARRHGRPSEIKGVAQ
jgi:hypothetical protein